VWLDKAVAIEEHNETHQIGHNKFSDWTQEEFDSILGYRPELRTEERVFADFEVSNADSVDWRDKGAVTPVKNQGSCGSCWSFSTTGAMEGAHQIATGKLLSLSEQQFVDCDYGLRKNLGCNGGLMDKAFDYAKETAIETEEDYPYTAKKGSCAAEASKEIVNVTSYYDVTPDSPDALKAALDKGPVSVAIQANTAVFQLYKSGVITSEKCGTSLDHGVLAVGYGTDATDGPFYIVKNSWGADWGDAGYVKIGIVDGAGICGIQSQASQPTCN